MRIVADDKGAGVRMSALIEELYPICRSITGDGVRQTLDIIGNSIPLDIHAVPSGTAAFDWTVPKEWKIAEAYVEDEDGRRVIDFADHNLHVVSYSAPVDTVMTLEELQAHLHSDPAHPDVVPYRTSYYKEDWGFCLADAVRAKLKSGKYKVRIDSALFNGELNWGEAFVKGTTEDEIVISTHICHPSLANDNLSGIAVCVELVKAAMRQPSRYSLRVLFIPGTIGSIVWLSTNKARLGRVKHGLIAVNLGDAGSMHYKQSRHESAEIDRAVEHVLKTRVPDHVVRGFSPYGYDERQFCSPGINLPFGCLSRTPYGEFAEYHTSADNLDFVSQASLVHSLQIYRSVLDVLQHNRRFHNLMPECEPQLGKRGLYGALGGKSDTKARQLAMLWVLNYSDSKHDLLDIADRSGISFDLIAEVAHLLVEHRLLREAR
jgi:aminopeptidase-like protein